MRFRRRRSRAPKEPLRWIRSSFQSAPFQTPVRQAGTVQASVSIVPLFDPNSAFGVDIEADLTVRRVILSRYPLLSIPTSVVVLTPFVADITWFLVVRERADLNIPVDPSALFFNGTDIIAGGTNYAQAFATDQNVPVWMYGPGQNWIDHKVNRVIKATQRLCLYTFGSSKPNCAGGAPFVNGAEEEVCFVHDFDVSVLYQRHMRR